MYLSILDVFNHQMYFSILNLPAEVQVKGSFKYQSKKKTDLDLCKESVS